MLRPSGPTSQSLPVTMSERLFSVALTSPPYATLTYALPAWLQDTALSPGTRVIVPLGAGTLRVGVVLGDDGNTVALPEGVTPKPLICPLDVEPCLNGDYLDMVRHLALRQGVTQGRILGNLLPAGLRTSKVRLRLIDNGRKRLLKPRELAGLDKEVLQRLGQLWREGSFEVLVAGEDAAASEMCVLKADPPWPLRPSAHRQAAILDFLYERGTTSRKVLTETLGTGCTTALGALLERGLVAIEAIDEASCACGISEASSTPLDAPQTLVLTEEQSAAVGNFAAAMDAEGPATWVLYGITGSGKTAVYLELAKMCLARGRSVLLLAPEVALACKLRRDVANSLPEAPVVLYHGYQTPAVREATFRLLATTRNQPRIIVGTRSALFLPVQDIGAVVLDEEHDSSFKQDEGLNYQAKEVAWFRVGQSNGLLVLGSATPDLKTWHAAREGVLPAARLTSRVGGGTLPSVELVDIRSLGPTDGILAPATTAALGATLAKGEQAVILLNRRGYAPLMYCLDCGTVARCPHCDIGLTYHKGRERLVCHYCGHSVAYPAVCPNCKGMHYLPMGEGTERLEESIASLLPPGGRVLRLDRDSTRRQGRMEEILEAFAREEAQVLVGTQMLSKGHHFPKVTLAVVADGDLGLNLPDYRASERTFQLLVQSSGRAGRGELPGKVLIQTRDPGHYCWQYVLRGDYEAFFEHEIAIRQRRRYPPFVRLALVRMSYPVDCREGLAEVTSLAGELRRMGSQEGVQVLGPAPAPLPLLRGRKRFNCLLKGADWLGLRRVYGAASGSVSHRHLSLSLDLDPVNML